MKQRTTTNERVILKTERNGKKVKHIALTFDAIGTNIRDDAVWCTKQANGFKVFGYVTADGTSLDAGNVYKVVKCEITFDAQGRCLNHIFQLTDIYIAGNYSFPDLNYLRNGRGKSAHRTAVQFLAEVAELNQIHTGIDLDYRKRPIEWLMSGMNRFAGMFLEKHAVPAVYSNRVFLRHRAFEAWAPKVFRYYADGAYPLDKEERLNLIMSGEWFRAECSIGSVQRQVYASGSAQITSPMRQEIDAVNLKQVVGVLEKGNPHFSKEEVLSTLEYIHSFPDARDAPVRK